jgi:hypothetical protein
LCQKSLLLRPRDSYATQGEGKPVGYGGGLIELSMAESMSNDHEKMDRSGDDVRSSRRGDEWALNPEKDASNEPGRRG